MSRSVRAFVAAFLTSALLLTQAAPAFATSTMNSSENEPSAVPVLFDAVILRPVGLMMTAVGAVGFCLVAPFMAITRPTDLGKPFSALVVAPARYTWVDRLGTH
jgi:ABC-type transport system involved in cytochrome c biogenesis permease subunit